MNTEARQAPAAYFKLARWDDRLATFREVKAGFESAELARTGALRPGRYRISRATEGGWADVDQFDVTGTAVEGVKPARRASGLRTRIGAGK